MKTIPPNIIENDSLSAATTVREFQPGEPTTLVEVFEHVARDHKRADTLNYKRDGRWLSISSDELLKRIARTCCGPCRFGDQARRSFGDSCGEPAGVDTDRRRLHFRRRYRRADLSHADAAASALHPQRLWRPGPGCLQP